MSSEKEIITQEDILKEDNLGRVRYLLKIVKGQAVFSSEERRGENG